MQTNDCKKLFLVLPPIPVAHRSVPKGTAVPSWVQKSPKGKGWAKSFPSEYQPVKVAAKTKLRFPYLSLSNLSAVLSQGKANSFGIPARGGGWLPQPPCREVGKGKKPYCNKGTNAQENQSKNIKLKRKIQDYSTFLKTYQESTQFPIYTSYSKMDEVKLVTIGLASANRIRQWAEKTLPNGKVVGEVTNANTLHHKTFKPQKGGLFCERIFGPLKDFECACASGKKGSKREFKKTKDKNGKLLTVAEMLLSNQNTTISTASASQSLNTNILMHNTSFGHINNYKRFFCSKCDVEYTWSVIRRYQLGYIHLNAPVTHVWYVKGNPSYISLLLDMKKKHLEHVTYCAETLTLENSLKGDQFYTVMDTPSEIFAAWEQAANKPKRKLLQKPKVASVYKHKNWYYFVSSFPFSNPPFLKKGGLEKGKELSMLPKPLLNYRFLLIQQIPFKAWISAYPTPLARLTSMLKSYQVAAEHQAENFYWNSQFCIPSYVADASFPGPAVFTYGKDKHTIFQKALEKYKKFFSGPSRGATIFENLKLKRFLVTQEKKINFFPIGFNTVPGERVPVKNETALTTTFPLSTTVKSFNAFYTLDLLNKVRVGPWFHSRGMVTKAQLPYSPRGTELFRAPFVPKEKGNQPRAFLGSKKEKLFNKYLQLLFKKAYATADIEASLLLNSLLKSLKTELTFFAKGNRVAANQHPVNLDFGYNVSVSSGMVLSQAFQRKARDKDQTNALPPKGGRERAAKPTFGSVKLKFYNVDAYFYYLVNLIKTRSLKIEKIKKIKSIFSSKRKIFKKLILSFFKTGIESVRLTHQVGSLALGTLRAPSYGRGERSKNENTETPPFDGVTKQELFKKKLLLGFQQTGPSDPGLAENIILTTKVFSKQNFFKLIRFIYIQKTVEWSKVLLCVLSPGRALSPGETREDSLTSYEHWFPQGRVGASLRSKERPITSKNKDGLPIHKNLLKMFFLNRFLNFFKKLWVLQSGNLCLYSNLPLSKEIPVFHSLPKPTFPLERSVWRQVAKGSFRRKEAQPLFPFPTLPFLWKGGLGEKKRRNPREREVRETALPFARRAGHSQPFPWKGRESPYGRRGGALDKDGRLTQPAPKYRGGMVMGCLNSPNFSCVDKQTTFAWPQVLKISKKVEKRFNYFGVKPGMIFSRSSPPSIGAKPTRQGNRFTLAGLAFSFSFRMGYGNLQAHMKVLHTIYGMQNQKPVDKQAPQAALSQSKAEVGQTPVTHNNQFYNKIVNNIYCLSHRELWDQDKDWQFFALYYFATPNLDDIAVPVYNYRNYDFSLLNTLFSKEPETSKSNVSFRMGLGIPIAPFREGVYLHTTCVNTVSPRRDKQNLNVTFSGAGIIQTLLAEFDYFELKKMDKQNRILLYDLNKYLRKLKKSLSDPMGLVQIEALNPSENNKKKSSKSQTKKLFKEVCKQRDALIRRTKIIRKIFRNYTANVNSQKGWLGNISPFPFGNRGNMQTSKDGVVSFPFQPSFPSLGGQGNHYNTQALGSFGEGSNKDSDGVTSVQQSFSLTSMVLTLLPVLPPDLRPIVKMGTQIAASDLNRLYQRVIYRNDRLKKFLKDPATNGSYEMKYAQRLLQEAVDNLIQNGKSGVVPEKDARGRALKSLSDLLKGKQGRFRQYLLGKRVDYSGRSVIVVGPKLKLHECGIPKEMALELFLPFLIKRILNQNYARTVIGAKALIQKNKPLTWALLREIMKTCPVLLNRAPTLHRLGFQAFQPKLVDGRAILLHPLVCPAFNADFDGDQMAVHVPITVEARTEAWKLMLARNNLLSPATGEPLVLPSQDMVLGCYYLTTHSNIRTQHFEKGYGMFFNSLNDVLRAYNQGYLHIHAIVWVKWNGILENVSGHDLEQPIEIRVNQNGYTRIIFSKTHTICCASFAQPAGCLDPGFNQKPVLVQKYNIIRTTPGKILFNTIIQKALSGFKSKD